MTRPWRIEGDWYPPGESRRIRARIEPGPLGRGRLFLEERAAPQEFELSLLEVSPRLGNTPRYLTFTDGAILEASDNDAVDEMMRRSGQSRGSIVHWLESRWRTVLVAVVITAGVALGMVTVGIPAIARVVAFQLPTDTLNQVSQETLAIMDRTHFEESTLSEARQSQLRETFRPMLESHNGHNYRVVFRQGGDAIGANAMALPDGTLIFTDQLIHLANNDNELLAILAHEVGHVEHRHGLRALIQTSLLSVGAMTLFGDVAGFAEMLAGLPVVFASLSYSRDHELEADAFSARWLDEQGIPRLAFIDMMARLRDWGQCRALFEDEGVNVSLPDTSESEWRARCVELRDEQGETGDGGFGLSRYLSTHPAPEDRLRRFEQH